MSNSTIYTKENLDGLWDQLKYNVQEKDKLVVAISTFFIGAISALLSIKSVNSWTSLFFLLLVFISFALSLIFVMVGFVKAIKSTSEQYDLLSDGFNGQNQLSDNEYQNEVKKIREKNNSIIWDKWAFILCIIGVILFPCLIFSTIQISKDKDHNETSKMQLCNSNIITNKYYYKVNKLEDKDKKKEKSLDRKRVIPVQTPAPSKEHQNSSEGGGCKK